MLNYLLKRLLYIIPTLLAISIITFVISLNAPGDPVESLLNMNSGEGQLSERQAQEAAYAEMRHKLGLDLPLFYFSVSSAASCDTLYKLSNRMHREVLERMAFTYGNWKAVANYYKCIMNLEKSLPNLPSYEVKNQVSALYEKFDSTQINQSISQISKTFNKNEQLKSSISFLSDLINSYNYLLHQQQQLNKYIPVIHWHGARNQYHHWLSGFVKGDFGVSYQDRRPVSSLIWDAIGWTLLLSLSSMVLAYLIAIPMGVYSAVEKGSLSEKSITSVLFMMYSLPNFWVATLAVIFLCGGDWLSWFPSPGADWPSRDAPFTEWFPALAIRLTLPLICYTYGNLAFISRQMRGGMMSVMGQDYIRTARAKGLSERQVVWKHAFKNALLPIITLFANIFPFAIAGSFVIEFIFSIPGMGKLTYEALMARNYPVIFTVMMFLAIMTLLGNLIADIIYAFADPRISYSHKRA